MFAERHNYITTTVTYFLHFTIGDCVTSRAACLKAGVHFAWLIAISFVEPLNMIDLVEEIKENVFFSNITNYR